VVQPVLRAVYVTDPTAVPVTPAGQVPMALLAALGERLAAGIAVLHPGAEGCGDPAVLAELARLERLGLQLQELAQVIARAQQLRHEPVDLGLALMQTVAEWSGEADRLGVELHAGARSAMVHANPAALKHLLDLLVEHALQQGRAVRLDIEAGADGSTVHLVGMVSSEPASSCPARETLAWQMLQWLARSLALAPVREAVTRGERLTLAMRKA
jgi:hypothetical protein